MKIFEKKEDGTSSTRANRIEKEEGKYAAFT